MTWRHSSPDMSSDGVRVEVPPCRPRVYRTEEGWTYYCPAHPEPHIRSSWEVILAGANYHAKCRARQLRYQRG